MVLPDYRGGGIVNLMSSLSRAAGAEAGAYPEAQLLPAARLEAAQNIILLVIDGLGYEYLCSRGAGGFLDNHNLGSLTSVCPSTTASAIPCFLTGMPPQQHGFTGWFTYFRELGDVLAVLPFRPRHGGDSLAASGVSPRALCGARPLPEYLPLACTLVMPEHIAGSPFNRAFSGDARIRPYATLKGLVKAIRAAVRSGGRQRQYIYAYWPEFDALAHQWGVGSEQVHAHFQGLDEALALLARQLAGSDSALLITADHGFIDSEPARTLHLQDHPELQETLLLPLCGEPRLAFCYVHPGREERFRAYVTSELAHCVDLYPSRQLFDEGWFGLGDPYPPLLERIGHYTLVMKENYKIKDWLLGERPYVHLGVHGGVSAEEMRVPLIHATL